MRSERPPQRVQNATTREKTSGITVGVIFAAGLGDTAAALQCQDAISGQHHNGLYHQPVPVLEQDSG